MTFRPAAVILAAGRGERIGTPKHRLVAGDRTFLEVLIRLVRGGGCDPVLCIVAEEEADRLRTGFGEAVRIVVNPDPARGMLSSLQAGIAVLTDVPGAFVVPVDHPHIQQATMGLLMTCAAGQPGVVVKPEYLGRGGHPVYVPAGLFTRITQAGTQASLRDVIARSGLPVIRVPVTDEGVVRNVNTVDDL